MVLQKQPVLRALPTGPRLAQISCVTLGRQPTLSGLSVCITGMVNVHLLFRVVVSIQWGDETGLPGQGWTLRHCVYGLSQGTDSSGP